MLSANSPNTQLLNEKRRIEAQISSLNRKLLKAEKTNNTKLVNEFRDKLRGQQNVLDAITRNLNQI